MRRNLFGSIITHFFGFVDKKRQIKKWRNCFRLQSVSIENGKDGILPRVQSYKKIERYKKS